VNTAESQSNKACSEKGFHVNFGASGGIPVKKFEDSFAMRSVSHFSSIFTVEILKLKC
jgi:hypothetical protein